MFRAVIFDLGGVVFPSPFEAFDNYDATAGLERGTVRALIRASSETGAWAALERGELTMDQFRSALESEAQAAGFTLDGVALLGSFGNGAGARPSMLTAIARIREHGLRVGALTNNWPAPDGRSEPNAFHSLTFDVVVESSIEGIRKPDPRIYDLVLTRLGVAATEAVFLDDLGINLKPARATRHDDDQGGRPRRRARRTRRGPRLPAAGGLMEIVWVRHAEPERIETGTGVPANPPLTADGRVQAERVASWLAAERVDIVVSSPQRRARETAAPIAAAHGLAVEIVEGLVEFDVQADHYIPMEELRAAKDERWTAMLEGRWGEFGGEEPDDFVAA